MSLTPWLSIATGVEGTMETGMWTGTRERGLPHASLLYDLGQHSSPVRIFVTLCPQEAGLSDQAGVQVRHILMANTVAMDTVPSMTVLSQR